MTRKLMSNRFQNAVARPNPFLPQFNRLEQKVETNSRPTCDQLKLLLKARRARATFFGAQLFADPAWDILLQAYVALLDKEPLLVSAICRESIVPPATALRWVSTLEQDGLLVRRHDPGGERRSWLELSAPGRIAMERYLEEFWPSILPV